jgi:hypothetical protein
MKRQLSPQAKLYVAFVIVAGVAVGVYLLASARVADWRWPPVALFGFLGIAASAFSIRHRSHLPSGVTHQIGTSFAYALLLLVNPAAVCIVLWVMNCADWATNRRRPLTAMFNMAQLTRAWSPRQARGSPCRTAS